MRIGAGAAMGLRVSHCLHLLQAHIPSAPISDAKTFAGSVVELSDCFCQHVGNSRYGVFNADTAVGPGMIVVEREYILVPILLPIFAGTGRHGSGGRTGIIEGFRQSGGAAV